MSEMVGWMVWKRFEGVVDDDIIHTKIPLM